MNNTHSPGRNPDVRRIVERLAALSDRESVSHDYVRLRIEVLKAQAATLAGLAGRTAAPVRRTSKPEGPALGPDMLPFDPVPARRLFDSIARARGQHGNPGADLARLRSAVGSEPGLLEDLTRRAAFGPDEEYVLSLAGRINVSPELVVFLGRLLAAPFVTHAVECLREQGAVVSRSDGSCPACGSTPALASLRREDGARVLHCSLCGHRWSFGRLVCPFCGGQDQSAVTRLTVAGEDVRWIEACDECKHYLKVIDLRRRPEGQDFIPLVEEVAGLCLDLVAEREGYLPKPPYAAVG